MFFLPAMTSYSPSVLALNDMLRHQLQLTRAFINTQQQVYTAYIGAMESEYKYTTLKDTKKVRNNAGVSFHVHLYAT